VIDEHEDTKKIVHIPAGADLQSVPPLVYFCDFKAMENPSLI
jgi:hypothetical protein